MDSFFAKIFLELQARIKSEVPEIVWIEQDLGQAGFEDFKAKVDFPCVLIDFPDTNYSGLSGSSQLADANIKFMLMFETYSQSYDSAPDDVRELALKYLEIERKLARALNGWGTDFFTPLMRTKATGQNQNEHGVRVRNLFFSCEFEEYEDEEKTVDVTFSFTGTIGSVVEEPEPEDEEPA